MRPSLYQVAEPMPDEAPSSWLLRTAVMHNVNVTPLMTAVGVRRRRRDWDLSLRSRFLQRVLYGTGVPVEGVARLTQFFQPFRRERWLRVWLRNSRGLALTSYCPDCLRHDPIPYWRAVWRFRYWVICPWHSYRMISACPACYSEVTCEDHLESDVFRAHSRLLNCPVCGFSRTTASSEHYLLGDADGIRRLSDLQRAVTAALLRGNFGLLGFGMNIPLSFLPGVLGVGAYRERAGSLGSGDIRHLKELESAIRFQRKTGYEGILPRARPGQYVTTTRMPWIGEASAMAEKVLRERFLEPVEELRRDGISSGETRPSCDDQKFG